MTIKPAVRKFTDQSGNKKIYIQVTYKRHTRFIPTEYTIPEKCFKNGFVTKHPNSKYINVAIANKINEYQKIIIEIGDRLNNMSCNDICDLLKTNGSADVDFFEYAQQYIDMLNNNSSYTYAAILNAVAKNIKQFTGKNKLLINDIDYNFLLNFRNFLKAKGMKTNSIATYLGRMRTIINYVIKLDVLQSYKNPFNSFKIKSEETEHRIISIKQVNSLINAEPKTKNQELSKDMFLLSFFLCGINIKDLLYLEKTNVKNKRLVFNRNKTNTLISIKIEPEARAIIKKYEGDKLLLNLKEVTKAKSKFISGYFTNLISRNISSITGIQELTTYYARHSWATIASQLGATNEIIAKGLGHANRSVTNIYIRFDNTKLDNINRKVIDTVSSINL